jgi:hypothetical protein
MAAHPYREGLQSGQKLAPFPSEARSHNQEEAYPATMPDSGRATPTWASRYNDSVPGQSARAKRLLLNRYQINCVELGLGQEFQHVDGDTGILIQVF